MKAIDAVVKLFFFVDFIVGSFISKIDVGGFQGEIQFTKVSSEKFNWKVNSFSSSGLNKIEIKSIPPFFAQKKSPKEVCLELKQSETLFTLKESSSDVSSKPSGSQTHNLKTLQSALYFRGLLITSDTNEDVYSCSIIRSTEIFSGENLYSQIEGELVGEVYIRSNSKLDGSFVYIDLYYTSKPPKESKAFDVSLQESCKDNIEDSTRLFQVTPSIDPTKPKGTHGNFVDDDSKVKAETFLVISSKGVKVACGKLRIQEPRNANAILFGTGSVHKLILSQISPFDETEVELDLTEAQADVTSNYFISTYPTPIRFDANRCNFQLLGHTFDPYERASSGTSTDKFPIGFLSKKNSVSAIKGKKHTLSNDKYLQLFGPYSVVGRSFITEDKDGVRRCGDIRLQNVDITTAVASFRYKPLLGHIYFRQVSNDFSSTTSVYHSFTHYDGSSTADHKYHVHINSIKFGQGKVDCKTTGGHYNPLNQDLGDSYKLWCNPKNPAKCEIGDLTGKHSKLSFDGVSQKFTHENFLPLSGPNSIVGRSVVIHDKNSGGSRISCADIVLVSPITLVSKQPWEGRSDATVEDLGKIKLTQSSQWEDTKVTLEKDELKDEKLNIHGRKKLRYSIYNQLFQNFTHWTNESNICSNKIISQVYNPLNVLETDQSPETQEMFALGEISKKSVQTGVDYIINLHDDQLSVAGRAVKINFKDSKSYCTNLEFETENSFILEALAIFKNDQLKGFIEFKQQVSTNGYKSSTTVSVQLGLSNSSKISTGHKYHVHLNAVENENSCDGIEGHYDPFEVKGDDYETKCSQNSTQFCEVGDLSKKHGLVTINDEFDWQFYNDKNLPLSGPNTIIGRSIRIHAKGEVTDHCATILPPIDKTFTICFQDSISFIHNDFIDSVAAKLKINKFRVIPLHKKRSPFYGGRGCHCVFTYIVGDLDQSKIKSFLSGGLELLDPNNYCKSSLGLNNTTKVPVSILTYLIIAVVSCMKLAF